MSVNYCYCCGERNVNAEFHRCKSKTGKSPIVTCTSGYAEVTDVRDLEIEELKEEVSELTRENIDLEIQVLNNCIKQINDTRDSEINELQRLLKQERDKLDSVKQTLRFYAEHKVFTVVRRYDELGTNIIECGEIAELALKEIE